MSFKIVFSQNTVLFHGEFKKFPNYKDFNQKIIDGSSTPAFKSKFGKLRNDTKFILEFDEKSPAPPGLEKGIWNKDTYDYFLEKISSKKNQKYRLHFKTVNEFPEFKRKKPVEILQESLEKTWKILEEKIKKDLPLSVLEQGKIKFDDVQNNINSNEKKFNERHENVICNGCYKKNFTGIRYICSECRNYNLCQECQKNFMNHQIHSREHTLIRVNKPINDENLINYNNLFGNNNKIIQTDGTSFKFDLSVVNTGENKLKNCYLAPVRFGDEYLSCLPKKIEEEMNRNDKCELEIVISINLEERGVYEGYFRMFTPKGLPFGDLLKVKAVYGE